MIKVLLAAVNAKYIHSNLGIYSLKAYAGEKLAQDGVEIEIEIGEYTINHQRERILRDIYERRPDIIGFSCYIWNISEICTLVKDLPKVLPNAVIWLGRSCRMSGSGWEARKCPTMPLRSSKSCQRRLA